jgi:transposase-like protein
MSEKDFEKCSIDKTAPEPANHAEQTEQLSYSPRFVCPNCGCELLVEIRTSVEKTIAAINSNLEIIYDKQFIHGADDDEIIYRCLECDYVPTDEKGDVIRGACSISIWLEEQAKSRMSRIKFDCPFCGGHHLDDHVEIGDEGYVSRIFRCHDCGEVVSDEDEEVLRKTLEWGRKCVEKHQE